MELKVINEIVDEIKNFKSIEEFNMYYQKHKDDIDNKTTQYLNKVYKIVTNDGSEYRITKKNCSKLNGKIKGGEIYLRKVNNNDKNIKELENDIIKADIEQLKLKITELTSTINQNDLKCKYDSSFFLSLFVLFHD